jgi:hypothetical protein
MKKLITLLTLLFILTSCWKKPADVNIDTNSGNTQIDWDTIIVTPWDENLPSTGTGTGEITDVVININENVSTWETITWETITISWSLNEQEVLDDIDSLLNDIILSAENE